MTNKSNGKDISKRSAIVSSNSLFHFTGSINTVKTILDKRFFWPKYSTQYSWNGHHFAIPAVCFCDIPLSRITDHIAYYGNFGFGMKKTWAVDNKLTPVFYMQADSVLYNKISYAIKKMFVSEDMLQFEEQALWLYLIKKTSGYDYKFGKCDNATTEQFIKSSRKFYDEREWRYIPSLSSYADGIRFSKDKFTKAELDSFSQTTLDYPLSFKYSDIQYIIVDRETDRTELIKNIKKRYISWNLSDDALYILISKIISCEQIINDF